MFQKNLKYIVLEIQVDVRVYFKAVTVENRVNEEI